MCKMPENQLYSTHLEIDNPIPPDGQIYDYKPIKEVRVFNNQFCLNIVLVGCLKKKLNIVS